MKIAILFLIALSAANAQSFSFGLKAGAVATGALDPDAWDTPEARRYVAGPSVEFQLPWRFAAEFDALYQRTGSRFTDCTFNFCTFSSIHANVFDFSARLKYRFSPRPVTPYVTGGIGDQWVAHASGNLQAWYSGPVFAGQMVDYTVQQIPISNRAENNFGGVVGAGLEFRAGRLKLAPEVRYTRWNARYWEDYGSRGYFTGSNLNQIDVLLGLSL